MDRINWKEAYKGSKSNVKPDAFMLADQGKVVVSLCRKGGDRNTDPPIEREIVYDRDYVINKLSKDTLLLILGLSKADYIALFDSVWESKQRFAPVGFPDAKSETRQRGKHE
jgi:hypothetical protein